MLYQAIVRALQALHANGEDIGEAIGYASENAFELVEMSANGCTVQELVQYCLENK